MIYAFGDFELDEERFELRRGGAGVPVQPKVLGLLFLLVRERSRAVGKRELLATNWADVVVGEASLARAIVEARRAISDEEHRRRFREIGPVDVVCTHMPPRIPWLCYDTVARKFEPGNEPLIAYIQEHQPRYSLFGHVHQPLASRGLIGNTQLVNVGHFQATGQGFVYEGGD